MTENYSRSLLRISVAQICQNLGWNSAQSSSLEVLTDVLERYLLQLGGICHRYSQQFGRTEPSLGDLRLAFKHMCINVSELEDYVHHVDPVPFAHELLNFPAWKSSNLEFPNPQSREILHHRKEHVDNHFPYMFPHLKDEIPNENQNCSTQNNAHGLKVEPEAEDAPCSNEISGEKRPAENVTLELHLSKRQRVSNPSLPEEAGQSQYEMTCVFMSKTGMLTTRPGCQGKLPEARLPPPNPRNIIENKENKAKDSGDKTVVIGDAVLKSSKSSKKSSHKKSLQHLHESASKAALEMTNKEIGKKSASSKAAAKFIKKLKSSKKTAKIFGKKQKDSKSNDDDNKEGIKDGQHKMKGGRKKKKEKKSAAIIDSDEELRNLSSPSSSRVPSPELGSITGTAMKTVCDSINAVLRDGPEDGAKVKKKKKKEGKVNEEKPAEPEVIKTQKKKGRPPKKDKKPEPPPLPPVDMKPFVSDKYSSAELKVYEFDDSPPDSDNIKSRRPSAPDESIVLSKSNNSSRSQKSSRILEQDELFAPEIKIETVKLLKIDVNTEKEKGKDDKKERSIEEKEKKKMRNDKDEKHYERNEDDDAKDKIKVKDIKRDKKDRKKDKEKKKKNREKVRDREKEKEKRREEKVKQEAKESRESSPVGFGVKLKIKIGGSAGPSSSMMVTGDDHSATPSPTPPSSETKRESMSPPKAVPKLYITKKGQEEKTTKPMPSSSSSSSSSMKNISKHKSSLLAIPVNSGSQAPHSNAASPVHSAVSSVQHSPSRATPPPPPFAQYSEHHQRKSHPPSQDSSTKENSKKNKGNHISRKDKDKSKKRGLKSSSSATVSKAPAPMPRRTRQNSSSLDHSSPPLPPPLPSPKVPRSRSQSFESPSPTRRNKQKSSSPSNSKSTSSRRHQSPSPSKPPTPGSTSPNAMVDWNIQDSPLHHSPTQNTPMGSCHGSPSHASLPRTPNPHRSPSPTEESPSTSPFGRTKTPEVTKIKEVPSPASSGKSSVGAKSRTVETETICVFYDDTGQKVWICPACKLQDDGSEMIGCDRCDNWYHWPCVGITEAPPEEQSWFCTPCNLKTKSSNRVGARGRGRPRGRGRGRGKKKIT